ncbi:MAG: tetratricopeptide repeat protein, partial [Planctomycetota bacterium]|jgi:tetratricopeptide (TPR) repeat protein
MTQTDTNLTMTGDLLGTLRYMSPEQVQAKHGVLDHRTNLYSLGITLYELLTLQLAFGGDDRQKLLRQVVEDDPRPPRQLNNAIPQDLETIILKATAKEPESRYATSRELADDLRRFQDDKPIRARRPSSWERLTRWSRRHRPIVWSAAVVLVMAAVGSLISTALILGAYRAEAAERERADASFASARDAVDSLLDRMEQAVKELAKLNGHAEVGNLVDYAMELDKRLPEEVRNSPRHRARLASMLYQRGWGSTRVGAHQRAEQSLNAAVAIYRQLAAGESGEYGQRLARCYYYLDDSLRAMGRFEEAEQARGHLLEAGGLSGNGPLDSAVSRWSLEDLQDPRDNWALSPRREGPAGQAEVIRYCRWKLAQAHALRGDIYLERGDFESAFADFDEAIRVNPKYAEAYWDRGDAHLKQGHHDRAIADLTEAICLAPKSAFSYSVRGLAYHAKGEYDRAIADFDEAIRLDGLKGTIVMERGTAYYNRGRSYLSKGQPDEALADFNEAIRLYPNFPLAYHYRGVLHAGEGDFERAFADFSKAIQLNPKNTRFYIGRGIGYVNRRKLDKGIEDFNEAIRLEPRSSRAWYYRGLAFFRKGCLDEAIDDLSVAIQLSPTHAGAYTGRAMSYCVKGEFDQAAADLNEAIRLNPKHPWPYWVRGLTYTSRGELDKAIADHTSAIQFDPQCYLAYRHRGNAYQKKGHLDQAISDYSNAIRFTRAPAVAYCRRALARARCGQFEYAQADVQKALSVDAGIPLDKVQVAWFLTTCPYPQLREVGKAVELAAEVVRQSPEYGGAWKALGAARYRVGDYHGACQALQNADRYCCKTKDAGWFFLAMTYWQLKDLEEAKRWYDKAATWMDENRPDDEELRRFREEAAELLAVADGTSTGDEKPADSYPSSGVESHQQAR